MLAVRRDHPEPDTPRYLPQVALATLAVVALPLAVVTVIQLQGGLRSPWLSMLVAVGLSVAASSAGSAIWMRRPGSRDLVFGDLMLWGYIRRLRAEKRIACTAELLGDSADPTDLDMDERMEGLQLLGSSLESRDPYTHGHTRRVTRFSEAIAQGMGLSHEEVAKVRTAAALHDVGKVLTPRAILTKSGALTDEEFEVVKRHAADGAQMVATLDDPELTRIVRHHHERLDGSGYPDGLTGSEIPLGARIVAVADTFDAMTSSRPYRRARTHKVAVETLSSEAGTKLDADAVKAFLAHYSGRRTVAWGVFGIAGPQRFLAWVLETGVAPVAKGVYTAGAAALIGGALAMPDLPPPAPEGVGSDTAAASSPGGPSAGAQEGDGGGPSSAGRGDAPSRRAVGVQPRTRAPGTGQPGAGTGRETVRAPNGQGSSPQGGGVRGSGGGQGSGGGSNVADTPIPTEVSLPGVRTPGGGVEVTAPGVGVNVNVPSVQLPGVKLQVPEVKLPE